MLNQVTLIGRLVQDPEIKELENGEKESCITLGVNKSYEMGADFIPCILKDNIATNTVEYCRKGDLIGIRGRLETKEDKIIVIVEKVSFLANRKKKEEE